MFSYSVSSFCVELSSCRVWGCRVGRHPENGPKSWGCYKKLFICSKFSLFISIKSFFSVSTHKHTHLFGFLLFTSYFEHFDIKIWDFFFVTKLPRLHGKKDIVDITQPMVVSAILH